MIYLIANIVFDQFERWVDLLEAIFRRDPADHRRPEGPAGARPPQRALAARRLLALRLGPVDGDPFDFEHRKPPNGTREATFAFQVEYEGCRRRDVFLRRQPPSSVAIRRSQRQLKLLSIPFCHGCVFA